MPRANVELPRLSTNHVASTPRVDAVLAISDFIAADIGWSTTSAVVLGVEHIPDWGPKPVPRDRSGPLWVGALMRLGADEANYKGTGQLLEMAAANPAMTREFAGRGTEQDAQALQRGGFRTLLNPTDRTRTQFLRDIDVFVTLSQWEGTNLPMVEAEALGTPALALATGAHPQFTPSTFDSPAGQRRPAGLRTFRRAISWSANAAALAQLADGAPMPPPPRAAWRRQVARAARVRRALTQHGRRATVSDQWRRRVG